MLLAYIVYLSLMVTLVTAWRFADPTIRAPRQSMVAHASIALAMAVSVALYGLILGLRYNVGGDYQGYVFYFLGVTPGVKASDVPYEWGFYWLIRILREFRLPPSTLFLATCTLQMGFIAAWLRRHTIIAAWYVYFLFTSLLVFESMNTIRQALACAIVLAAIPALNEKRFLRYSVFIFGAGLIHSSAFIFLPLYFILNHDWLPYRRLQMAILLLAYIVAYSFHEQLLGLLPLLSLGLDYNRYTVVQDALFYSKATSALSPSVVFDVLTDLLIIYSAPILKQRFERWGFRIYYNLYFIGALLTPFAIYTNYIPFGRLAFGFTAFKPVALAFLMTGLRADKESRHQVATCVLQLALVAVYLLWFLRAIWNKSAWCAPFQFV